jgi:hypothetical protein
MKSIVRISMSVAAAAIVLMPVLCDRANGATVVAGPGPSLTVVETLIPSYTIGSTLSTLYAYSGSPQNGFSVPVSISEPGDGSGAPDLAVDGAGDVLAVWSAARLYPARSGTGLQLPRGIWYARRPAGRSFLPPRQLAPPAPEQFVALAAMSRTGEAAVAYESRGAIFLRRARANRDFGPATLITRGTLGYVGFDAAGELLIVSSRANGPRANQLQVRFATPLGKLDRAQTIGSLSPASEYLPGRLAVSMNAHGATVIAWTEDFVLASYRKPRGQFGPTQRLTPPVPRDSDARPVLANVVMDERGRAIFGLGIFGGIAGMGYAETRFWNGKGSPSAPARVGGGVAPEPGMSLAENKAGEAAAAYSEGFGSGVGVSFSSEGQPFGSPQRLVPGTCPATVLMAGRESCEGIPTLVGAQGRNFFTVLKLPVPLQRDPEVFGQMAEIRGLTRAGATPPSYVSLPEPVSPEPRSDPASVVNVGATTTVDARGRIHARVQCGTDEGGCSVQMAVRETASHRLTLGRLSLRLGGFVERPVAIVLSRTGRREMARRRKLHVRLLTRTTGAYGPALETAYSLTLVGAHSG